MDLTRPLGALAGLLVAGAVLGSLVSLLTGPVVGDGALGAIVVVALLVVAVAGAVAVGARSREWVATAGYW